jgi:hypothetical protein
MTESVLQGTVLKRKPLRLVNVGRDADRDAKATPGTEVPVVLERRVTR